MGFIGSEIGYRTLHMIRPRGPGAGRRKVVDVRASKLGDRFGERVWEAVAGKSVIDFGCGTGADVIEIAKHGATQVIGVDIREKVLTAARQAAEQAGVVERCRFTHEPNCRADLIFSIDAFEHFREPDRILEKMAGLLKPTGSVWIAFGPPWRHPRGGHGLAVFPWAHLIFTESALMRWRSDFRQDRAARFHEREDGLNQMTIERFRRLIAESPFHCESLELLPIRAARWICWYPTQEFFTSLVRCCLTLKKSTGNGKRKQGRRR